ncbi:MAG: hypothetical protein K2Y37_20145 [Pirellulales bacterium]|nr:hypothetical protein [Pirellulales bacterium]
MVERPKRRWFRFRLSTVLILTAIAAWGMACRPTLSVEYSSSTAGKAHIIGRLMPHARELWWVHCALISGPFMDYDAIDIQVGPNPELKWPVIAFFSFLVWKAAWAVVEGNRIKL